MASSPYFSLAVLFVAALGFGLAPLGLAWLWQRVFSPAKPNRIKNAIYECGLESKGDAWVQFHSAYYLYAIIFLIFDVEAVFLLPFAVAFSGLGVAACISMLVFVLLLIEGLAWAWAKGVLTWAYSARRTKPTSAVDGEQWSVFPGLKRETWGTHFLAENCE
jgi:NADH-quinone oxidoreductase subunit A